MDPKYNQYKIGTFRNQILNNPIQPLWKYGFKINSQNEEDGILYHIFTLVGTTNKKIIEICAGNGKESCSANLLINHGFSGLLMDGSPLKVKNGIKYFKEQLGPNPPIDFINVFIHRDNILDILKSYPYYLGNIDLLSFDMDGVDYWILKKIIQSKLINPRVIILECHDIIPHHLSLTVPYKKNFSGWNEYAWKGPNWSGASISAFIKILPNYNFIGTEKRGFNACFVRNDINQKGLQKITDIDKYYEYISKMKKTIQHQRWESVKHLGWISV